MEQEVNHKYLDSNIPRKGKVLQDHFNETHPDSVTPPFFSLIEFNLSGLCNRTCVFCPRVDPSIFPNVNEHLPVELYKKTMRELAEVNYDGMILFSGFGEPLLYKPVELLIEMSKKYCPNVRNEMVTNGDLITVARLKSLFASGLNTLLISMYDGPEQEEYFTEMMDLADLTKDQVILRKRWLPPEQNYGITLVNRSGMVEISEVGVTAMKEPMVRRCFYPFYQVVVDYDGSVLLCTHDWGKKLIVGNLNDQSIHELWDSPKIQKVRMNLAKADRSSSPCNLCDADGTMMGQGHFEQWMDYYKQSQTITS